MLKAFLSFAPSPIKVAFGMVCIFSTLAAVATNAEQPTNAQNGIQTAIVGRLVPTLTVTDASGQKLSLRQVRGKRALLLTFFPRCFTGNCTSQLSSLRDSYPALQKAGIEVWGVSTDAAGGLRGQQAFSRHLKLPFPLIPDVDRRVSLAFGAVMTREQMAARMSVFIDKNGVVRWFDKQMDVRTHGPDVLARVKTETHRAVPSAK